MVAIVDALEAAGVDVWLDGGWGVDALLGEQTRAHDDLDVVVALDAVPALTHALAARGYRRGGGLGPPESFELVDEAGRQVDVHPVVFDAHGDGLYRMEGGGVWPYPARGFEGRGSVVGRAVRCLTAEVQVICHGGYEFDDDDRHDLRALCERFGLPLPAGI